MTVALLSLLGVAIGAALQFVFSRVLEERRHARELRAQSYSDYIEAVAGAKHSSPEVAARNLEHLTNAKVRIGLHGSTAVVQKLATFENLGGGLTTAAQTAAFVAVLGEMRQGRSDLTDELQAIVFGTGKGGSDSPHS